MIWRGSTRRWLGIGALTAGVILMALNLAGLIIPIPEHPESRRTLLHKTKLVRPSYEATLQALSRIDSHLPIDQRFTAVNEIIASRVVHYWPGRNETDPNVMYSFFENWYLAAIQRIEAWLAKAGLAKIDIARVGRRDFRGILAKGVGLCGMTALAVVDYFREHDQPLKILALGGHEVAYASVDGRNYILDPDYNVFIPDVPAPPARSMSKLIEAYSNAGYSHHSLSKLERIYAQSSMKLLDMEDYQGRWKRSINRARLMKWLVPIVLLGLGGIFLWRSA